MSDHHQTRTKLWPYKTLGFTMSFKAPTEVSDIERITGKVGICQEHFYNQYCFQDRNVAFREKYSAALEELVTSRAETDEEKEELKRKTESKPLKRTGEVREVFTETEQDYKNRIEAHGKVTEAESYEIAERVNAEIGEWSGSSVSDRKPAAPFYELADSYLAKISSGATNSAGRPITEESVKGNLEAKLGVSFEATFGDWNRDNIARALKQWDELEKRKKQDVLAE